MVLVLNIDTEKFTHHCHFLNAVTPKRAIPDQVCSKLYGVPGLLSRKDNNKS